MAKGSKHARHAGNKGMLYEDDINDIMAQNVDVPLNCGMCDTGFIHRGATYYVEVKNKKATDYGQKKINWNPQDGWHWAKQDVITQMYDQLNVLNQHIPSGFVPNRYTVNFSQFNRQHRILDLRAFDKDNIPLTDINFLYEFYARRNCYYIQIENYGFYYLERDDAGLGVPQYKPNLSLRMRGKAHRSIPAYNYSFFAVIKGSKRGMAKSGFDLQEGNGGRLFPPIDRINNPSKKRKTTTG